MHVLCFSLFLFLLQGDIVALMGGDKAPCLAEVLRFEAEDDAIPPGKIGIHAS